MVFAVDIGNTNITLGCIKDGEICNVSRIETLRRKTEYEYAVVIEGILGRRLGSIKNFEGAIVSSVVPELTQVICLAIKIAIGVDTLVVGAGLKTGLNIGIDDPAQLGPDLVAGAVAALSLHEPPLIVIDIGTATTITVLDANSKLLGGAIMPGPTVSTEALAMFTSQLPRISFEAPQRCISTNTIDCMKSGSVFGTAAALDGMIDRIEEELGAKTYVIATGGLAGKVVSHCRHSVELVNNLMMRGLALLWDKNKDRLLKQRTKTI